MGQVSFNTFTDESSESDEEEDTLRSGQRDVVAIRLANELDPWDKWEQTCRRRAWYVVRHRGKAGTTINTPTPAPASGVDEIEEILSRFQLQQSYIQKKEREAFEQRNASLWEGIDKAIRDAEQRAADEAEQLASARRRQEEAEKQAKIAREAELKRIEDEKKAAEAKKREEDARKQEQEQQQQKEMANNAFRGGKHVWPVAQREYEHWRSYMTHIKEDILASIATNAEWKKQCFTAKRTITPKVGQLTNSKAEISRITLAISDVLQQARNVPDKDASYRLYTWMLNHLSKCLIRQAEQEVAARQETAFPLARLVMGILLRGHAKLGDVFIARLVKKCPWVLGYVPERGTLTEEEHRKLLGFKTHDETLQSYVSRMVEVRLNLILEAWSSTKTLAEHASPGQDMDP
ncbi:Nuclear pore complex nucleoporin component [Malassezia equina]|uniref:mRNA export factor GLE1 n=1 Tax=Malassezia equina TaxID=1381935 RepID=A0AAF0IXQ7_9BASI|nr:Nuclear pore complex nucleoporin component [Malassezia equina]